ncbi:MAG: GtrA family protein [Acidimicrobiia bacterium]
MSVLEISPNLSVATIEPMAHPTLVTRLRRCATVSVITTVLSLVSLVILTVVFHLSAMAANVTTTALATVPSYHLNRRWTWQRRDASDPWREIAPFWALSFAGLALSTITVGIADHWAARMSLAPALHTVAILAGHLGGFALLWIVQFVLLDRVLFARSDKANAVAGAADAA